MNPDKNAALWTAYRARAIDQTVHPDDWMFQGAARGWADYNSVGESGIRAIHAALLSAPTEEVRRAMDYGCGHGRVARHLRAYAPDAELFFADIDTSGIWFCAQQFRGQPTLASDDLSKLALPSDLDLIWVGSVFTHIDYRRAELLFDALIGSLAVKGTLVATFRGPHAYRTKDALQDGRDWQPMLDEYEATGAAYQSYGDPRWGDWGLCLFSIERIVGLGRRQVDVRLIGYTEAGWANCQDVAVWSRL
jgi:SAM-dependent methyltransferase